MPNLKKTLIAAGLLLSASTAFAAQKERTTEAPLWFQQLCATRLADFDFSLEAQRAQITYEFSRYMAGEDKPSREHYPHPAFNSADDGYYFIVNTSPGNVFSSADGKYHCGRGKVNISISVLNEKILIPEQISEGSCAFVELLTHEMEHAKVHQNYLDDTLSKNRDSIKRLYGKNIIYATTAEEVGAYLDDFTKNKVIPYLRATLEGVKPVHAVIDSPVAVEALKTSCNGELRKYIKE